MSRLHPAIRGARGNSFCAPAALVSALGIDIDAVTLALRDVSGKSKIFGVSASNMAATLTVLGAVTTPLAYARPVALTAFASTAPDGVYVVFLTGHFVALDVQAGAITVCDNHTIYPLPLDKYRRRRVRVKHAWRIQS